MKSFDIENSNYAIRSDASIQEAMEAITLNHRGCVVVVDGKNVVMGVVSDGDIRRALIKGAISHTPVEKVMNTNFSFVKNENKETLKNPEKYFFEHQIEQVVPVVGNNNELIEVLVRGGKYQEE